MLIFLKKEYQDVSVDFIVDCQLHVHPPEDYK